MKKTLKGMTLIEVGIVMVILSVLSGILVPRLSGYISQASYTTDISNAKVIYENTMLVMSTNEDVMWSFYNTSGAGKGFHVWDEDGNKTSSSAHFPVARMAGVDLPEHKTLCSLSNPTDKRYCWAWEDTGSNSKATVRQRAANHFSNDQGHATFVVALSEKMGFPVEDDAAMYSKKYRESARIKMRVTTHPKATDVKRKYTYKWIISFDDTDRMPHIFAGYDQGTLGYELYPNTDPEYTEGAQGYVETKTLN